MDKRLSLQKTTTTTTTITTTTATTTTCYSSLYSAETDGCASPSLDLCARVLNGEYTHGQKYLVSLRKCWKCVKILYKLIRLVEKREGQHIDYNLYVQFISAKTKTDAWRSVIAEAIRIMIKARSSPQQGDLRLSGLPFGQGTDGWTLTRDRRVHANLRAGSLATVPPTPRLIEESESYTEYNVTTNVTLRRPL
ncbi:hypothetical protein PoB_000141700 [Plakobranchus ocellatus]|uniref:Uncharacterized protein n=1 Tax=Plakobranchus ocellatus TaxID=259542 RepID=A0AAV3XWS3_9GAST|nr:hypothetical protein PoB_000141700 [Plakobranchus ocellatus]